jgi:hypothetical protein
MHADMLLLPAAPQAEIMELQPALREVQELRSKSAALRALLREAPSYEAELAGLEAAAREAQRLRERNFELRMQASKLEELRGANSRLKVWGGDSLGGGVCLLRHVGVACKPAAGCLLSEKTLAVHAWHYAWQT